MEEEHLTIWTLVTVLGTINYLVLENRVVGKLFIPTVLLPEDPNTEH